MSDIKSKSWISFRVKPSEYETIQRHFSKSAHRKLSEYARNVLLQKPVHIRVRNESADALLNEMLQVKKELSAIGNNYNQAISKLYTLNHIDEVKSWLMLYDKLQQKFTLLCENIFQRMSEIHRQWLSE